MLNAEDKWSRTQRIRIQMKPELTAIRRLLTTLRRAVKSAET